MKLYIETSVPNFLFADDIPEKQEITKKFFEKEVNKYEVFISQLVLDEIKQAPLEKSKQLHKVLPKHIFQVLDVSNECKELANKYVQSDIIPSKYKNDALHIAIAVVNMMDVLISWNMEHIVKLKTVVEVNKLNKN